MQDYLKAICNAGEWDDTPVTTSVIASRVGVSASSASEMVRKLALLGYLRHEPYGAVELTPPGRAIALRVVRRHRLVETFLVAELGYTWDEVHDDADILEHAISDRMLARMDAKLGFPRRDPHGDPIPGADGTMEIPPAKQLSALQPGDSGLVVRISDDEPEMLRYFQEKKIVLDAHIEVLARLPFGAGTSMRIGGAGGDSLDLGDQAAEAIWLGTTQSR
ncbi:metal-dependent transcriptional regulator [Nakamurella antarctica]|uniref:Manganese transport regulator n=2 Tax=Nakamurella antarctica TaxID=1902245 RepID=A0A3G8ZPY1_9ACTN|nr:metal-dependent transcriptional regulator [Nakamurella antarctica]